MFDFYTSFDYIDYFILDYLVDSSNLEYFTENINEIIESHDYIGFDDVVSSLTLTDTLDITSDISLIAGDDVKINCPTFSSPIFHIK